MNKRKLNKILRIAIITAALFLISLGIGMTYDFICRQMEKSIYPLKYEEYVEQNAAYYNVPREIVYAVIKTESNFKYDAVSNKGAVGLMQIMPDTFEWLTNKTGEDYGADKLYDPAVNIKYGVYLLSILQKEFLIWDTVYAAYNAGMGNVRKWLESEEYGSNGHLKSVPFKETSKFIAKVNEAKKMYNKIYFTEE